MQVTHDQPPLGGSRLGFWIVVILGVFAWAPATYPGYWQGLEGFAPIFESTSVYGFAQDGVSHDFWRSAGSGALLLVRPLLAWMTPTAAVRATFILLFILGGLGLYSWLAPRLGDRGAGLAGLLYMLLPPVLATVYVRGSLGDATILALLPMALAGLSSHALSRSLTGATVAVIALVWMWQAQAGLALLVTILLLLYSWLVERRKSTGLIVIVSSLAGALSLWSIWSLPGGSPVVFGDHFLYPHQLFAGSWQTAPSQPGWQDRYPFQLGAAAVVLALVSVWHWRFVDGPVELRTGRLLRFSLVAVLVIIGLSLWPAAPLWRWSGAEHLLTYPWQVILLAAPFLALLAGSLPSLNQAFAAPPMWAALVSLVVLGSFGNLQADFTQVEPPLAPVAVIGAERNLVILRAEVVEQPDPAQAQVTVVWQVVQPLAFDYNIFLQAQSGDEAAPSVVAQLDTQPLADGPPATLWRPGEIFTATYRLDLADYALPAAGGVRYVFGFYDWRNGYRLPVDGGIADKLVLYGN